MRRGTNPIATLDVGFDTSEIIDLHIAFAQNGKIRIEKILSEVELDGTEIKIQMTQADTLNLIEGFPVQVQMRCKVGDAIMASDIMTGTVEGILKDGVLFEN